MEIMFLCVVVFLFILAIFDLVVGVSNDAVNFLNSAVGSGAASFRRILIVASIGVFIGAAMSNGMMDIARHGIFQPENFSFYDLICIFMAVMVTDIILLDIFNTLGMPTSTTVSMVFELLGATFIVAVIKMAGGCELGFSELLNTGKALSVILGIFLSVAIAFFFGTVVQFIVRLIFAFNYRSHMTWKIGIFGGICTTAIVYFLLIKGLKDLVIMTPELKMWIADHTFLIIAGCMVVFTLIMQLLHFLGANVLKIVVLIGTFALAMAFAGNDLVNFIGVPLSGLASYQDYIANGAGDAHGFMMGSLRAPANTSVWFLAGAGAIMVAALVTSKKARKVSQTEIGLATRNPGDEMFGSSPIARRLVRWALSVHNFTRRLVPVKVRSAIGRRFNADEAIIENGAAFDLVRGAVNLVLAGALIAVGTSMKLPLSTTFVTFMVAMGTSLADRAWSRESAVFRITGVISVIGGWFLTAGAAFIGAGIIVALMHFGGQWVITALAILTIVLIVRSNRRFRNRREAEDGDVLFNSIITCTDTPAIWPMLLIYISEQQRKFITFAMEQYKAVTGAFIKYDASTLSKSDSRLAKNKTVLKNARRKETLCLSRVPRVEAIDKSTWFYLGNNCCMGILYNLRRINEVCLEHIDNNFNPLPAEYAEGYNHIGEATRAIFADTLRIMETDDIASIAALRSRCDAVKNEISDVNRQVHMSLTKCSADALTVLYVYINLLQETQEMVSSLRKLLRAYGKLHEPVLSAPETAR